MEIRREGTGLSSGSRCLGKMNNIIHGESRQNQGYSGEVIFEKVLAILAIMGWRILHTAPLGTASVMKVVTNYLAGAHLVSTGEAFMVAKKVGVDLGVAYEAIRISSGNSFVHETERQLILNGSYSINFTMEHEVKDMSLFDKLC